MQSDACNGLGNIDHFLGRMGEARAHFDLAAALRIIPGVIEHGLFIGLADQAIREVTIAPEVPRGLCVAQVSAYPRIGNRTSVAAPISNARSDRFRQATSTNPKPHEMSTIDTLVIAPPSVM